MLKSILKYVIYLQSMENNFNSFQTTFVLDSFIEYVLSRHGYAANHYIAHKKINNVWLTFNDSRVRKSYMGHPFQINMAFYRNTSNTVPITYNYDFAIFKQIPRPRLPKIGKMPVPPKTPIPQTSSKVDEGKSCEDKNSKETTDSQVSIEPEQEKKSDQDSEVKPQVIGHIHIQSNEDFEKECIEKPKLLVVHIKRYPNLLKRYQEGNVVEWKSRPSFKRLTQIKKCNVLKAEVLDLDLLAHIAFLKENQTIEVETVSEGRYRETYERKNPIEDDTEDEEDSEKTEIYEPPEDSTEDKEKVLWNKSQQKLAEIKGNRHSASAHANVLIRF